MKRSMILFVLLVSVTLSACKSNKYDKKKISDNIPSLEDLSGVWVSADSTAMEPSVRNFRGQALLNRDMTSVSWFVSAPYSGGYHTGVMKINGKTPKASSFRWQPFQALRKGILDSLNILSSTRMLFDKDAIMWKVEITNTSAAMQNLNIDLDLIGFISKYSGDWQWWYPYPKLSGKTTTRDEEVENIRKHIGESTGITEGATNEFNNGKPALKRASLNWPADNEILNSKKYFSKIENNCVTIYDTETNAKTAFKVIPNPSTIVQKQSGGTAVWKLQINPGETKVIKYLMTYGDSLDLMNNNLAIWSSDFDQYFDGIKTSWDEKWAMIFKPGNSLISGCFPTLETEDSLAAKVYYTSPLTMLYLINTNLPEHKKVFLTGGPRWGASITFFWDITLWSTLWAMVDPAMMKEHISDWIKINPGKYYGKDNFGGNGVGNGYSANYWALFQLIRDYITVSGDYNFLDETIYNKSVLQHLENYALNWKKLSIYGKEGCHDDMYKLADFGDNEWNLLECVPTYKHIVPSFNIGYVWMMRETAEFFKLRGELQKADSLNSEAAEMVKRILKLYAGNGVWNSLYPNNKKIEVRHCMDFSFFGKYIPDDIPPDIKNEMMEFVYRELLTDHWMRAQSLSDIAADKSDRTDHGPLGAFDGWPADIMDALAQMGYPQKALDFYHSIEPVTYEGCWSQSHELWGNNKKEKSARIRIPERGWNNRESSSGVAFSQVMVKDFFGFYPQINGEILQNKKEWPFRGKLHHVHYKNEYYSIEFKAGKPVMLKETIQ